MRDTLDYQGMRWFKCDLHVHTPEDARHWNDSDVQLHSPRNEGDIQVKARRFLDRCHEFDLDCIAVTDHNFSSEIDPRNWFLTHLIEQNKFVAKTVGRSPLIIFPGFELDIRYHILCLFNPVKKGCKLQELSDTLATMGLPLNGRFVNGTPQPPKHPGGCWSLRAVLDKVQKDLGGIVIASHAFSNDGICNDSANLPDFRDNPDLYAVEVNTWPPPNSKIQSILDGSNKEWRRPNPYWQPAPLCNSDAKSLQDTSNANNLGYRYSWIKMSTPSCEALRQAFLDWESRICLEKNSPRVDHTYIQSISISGTKFLAEQTVIFSPHLNCIIGGRGSGKSMLFESIRLGLRGEMSFKDVDEKKHVAIKQINRLKGIFNDSARIELRVYHDDVEDCFVVDASGQPARIEKREVGDPPTVFRRIKPLIFSQEQITQLADSQESLLDFIDNNLVSEQLEPYRAKAQKTIEQLKAARGIEEIFARLDGEVAALEQEVAELSRQLAAKAEVQKELKKHRAAREAQHYLNSLIETSLRTEERLKDLAEDLEAEPPPLGSRVDTFPEKSFFEQVEEKISTIYRNLSLSIRSESEKFRENIDLALAKDPERQKIQAAIREAEESFYAACSEKGLDPQEAEKIREAELQQRAKQAELDAKRAEREGLQKQKLDMTALWQELANCWKEEYQTRREVLQEIATSPTIPRTECGKPVVETSINFANDRNRFVKIWGELAPKRTTTAGRVWDTYSRDGGDVNIGDQLFEAFQLSLQDPSDSPIQWGNPIQWLELHLDEPECLPPLVRQYLDDIKNIREQKVDQWFDLALTRIPDIADLSLLRSDGTKAGSFLENALSTGQKNTAILSLLMAQGNGPVLIDQPEDELDSEFLFRELVPMLRHSKNKRQLIIVTHNANIPVNADAEFVYALQAKNGRGVCRTQGGLDRPAVTEAILDIMEGSEVAFRKRKEKYHF